MTKFKFFFSCFLFLFFAKAFCNQGNLESYPTYFTYSEQELAPLAHLQSSKQMTHHELSRWDKATMDLISQEKQDENASRIMAYLYVAQRDAAYLSHRLRNKFEGSFDPISKKVLGLFFPFLNEDQSMQGGDPYSQTLADIVLAKIKARWSEDLRSTKPYEIKRGEAYWTVDSPFIGLATGSWKPWVIKSASQFRAPPPPALDDPFWKEQIQKVKEACENITTDQKRAVYFWAGMGGKGSLQTGNWLKIANDYMWNQHVDLPMLVFIRSILAMAIEDSAIAVFDSKYTYWVKRPSMMDPSIHTLIPAPHHPSYPAGHATVSATAATVLLHFFPQARQLWMDLAHEAGLSRIWCGIHFPLDNQAGIALGEKVGQAAIESAKDAKKQPVHQ